MNQSLFLALPIRNNETVRVDCRVYSKDLKIFSDISLVIDTGASRTSIKRSTIMFLKYGKDIRKDTISKQTAIGTAYFDTVNISQLDIHPEFRFKNLKVDILDWEDGVFTGGGVIGMDILSRLHFHSNTKTFTIQSRPFDIKNKLI